MEIRPTSRILNALAQETRLAIYRLLAQQGGEGLAAGSIAKALTLAPATLSFHLRELAQAGLVRGRPRSRYIYYSADNAVLQSALDYLMETCRATPVTAEPPAAGAQASIAKPVVRPKPRPA